MVLEFPHYMETENKLQLLNIFGAKDIDLLYWSVISLFQTFFFPSGGETKASSLRSTFSPKKLEIKVIQ
jgi:hypothetical protein